MSELAFIPANGKLGQMIFENPGAEIEARLEFFIEIAFQPLEIDGETVSPLLRANSIVVPGMSWRALENTEHEFPWAPKPGSIEAAIPLFYEQNPADVTRLSFGSIQNGKIQVRFDTEVDFEIEADRDDLGQVALSFDLPLEIAPLRIATSLEKSLNGDPAAITEAVSHLVAMSDYGAIEKVPGGFEFPIA